MGPANVGVCGLSDVRWSPNFTTFENITNHFVFLVHDDSSKSEIGGLGWPKWSTTSASFGF